MPVQTIFENLRAGLTVREITEVFDVTEDEVDAVPRFISRGLELAPAACKSFSTTELRGPSSARCEATKFRTGRRIAIVVLSNSQRPNVKQQLAAIAAAVDAAFREAFRRSRFRTKILQ